MWWLIASISAFFLLALASVIDKFLLTKTSIVPISFAFFITAFAGILGSLLIFFDSSFDISIALMPQLILGGVALFFGLYLMFLAVARAEVSKANPLIVALTPISVFLLSLFLDLELIGLLKIAGIVLVIIAGYWLSQLGLIKTRLNRLTWLLVIIASLLLGAANVFSKIAYDNLSFITAFVWIRWWSLLAAVLFVTVAGQWQKIFFKNQAKKGEVKNKSAVGVLIVGQLAGSGGVILLQIAIKLGNVIIVTALNAVQFFFVIFFVWFLSRFYPRILKEDVSRGLVVKKVLLSLILALGLVLILI